MPYDPRQRLRRAIPGERFFQEDPAVVAVFARAEAKEIRELVPRRDLRQGREVVNRRNSRKIVTPGPNAPSLIRLVRYPFALRTVRPNRQRYYTKPETIEKLDWQAEIASAKAERVRGKTHSPGRTRPRAFAIRPSKWKIMKNNGGNE